jgi:outer membrane protein
MKQFKTKYLLIFFVLTASFNSETVVGQDSVWTLQQCIEHAKRNNLSVNRKALSQRTAEMTLLLSKTTLFPELSLSSSYGRNYGRSINPTTNQFENRSYDFTGLNARGNVVIFGWFKKQDEIKKNQLLYRAAVAEQNQVVDDISLNIATAYLRILLAKEQLQISAGKIMLSEKQAIQTELLLNSGKSNGQDMAQIRTQLSEDSAIHIKNLLSYQLAVIDIKALLNLDFESIFSPSSMTLEGMSLDVLAVQPNEIYAVAEEHFGSIRSNELKIKVADKTVKIAKANLYPQFTLSGSSGTNYSSSYNEYLPTGETIRMPWGKQVRNNLSHSFSLGLTIPLFNGFTNRYVIRQARVDLQTARYQDLEAKLQLKQDVYKAYNDAQTSLQTYKSTLSTEQSAKLASEFAALRYEKGLIAAMDLLIAQNKENEALINISVSKYDLAFKILIIDYYLGKEMK